MITERDLEFLNRAAELASVALSEGHQPFGSILVSGAGEVLFEDHNRIGFGDRTQHPEFAIARWAAANLSEAERAASVVYTSGEPCTMCAAAHGWVGLGRIVYASSTGQLTEWLEEFDAPPTQVRPLPVGEVIAEADIDGPVEHLAAQIRELHKTYYGARA